MTAQTPDTVAREQHQHRAHVIADDAEALAVVRELAPRFAVESADRDADRRLPFVELDELSASGLLGITVPREHGGAEVRISTLVEVYRQLAAADPNIAQIPQSHVVYLDVLRLQGSPAQRGFFYAEALAGRRFANAQSERHTRHVQEHRTRITPAADGSFVVDGLKHYSTGALFAHWIGVLARDADDKIQVAYLPAGTSGVTVVDDWDGMGQRTTASGTVRLDDVRVPAEHVVPQHLTFTGPQVYGAAAQVLHAAIDAGIADAALADAAEFVRTKTRPWFESGVDSAADDRLLVQRVGELAVRLRTAEAVLAAGADAVDAARADLTDATAAEASLAVAAARTVTTEVSIEITGALFELAGTRSALNELNLHRHWRNARTHTLHDPVRWKVQHLGRHLLFGTPPPRHGLI